MIADNIKKYMDDNGIKHSYVANKANISLKNNTEILPLLWVK